MITIVNGTNRKGNLSSIFSNHFADILSREGEKVKVLFLEDLPSDFIESDLYGARSAKVEKLLQEFIIPADKLLWVVPEYNGSYAGIVKLFLESCKPEVWHGKKAAMTGIASGRAGNLVGMDHLNTVLNYLQIHVMPQRLPISRIKDFLQGETITDKTTLQLMQLHAERLIRF